MKIVRDLGIALIVILEQTNQSRFHCQLVKIIELFVIDSNCNKRHGGAYLGLCFKRCIRHIHVICGEFIDIFRKIGKCPLSAANTDNGVFRGFGERRSVKVERCIRAQRTRTGRTDLLIGNSAVRFI